jgi:glycosyltransferase involved in cell wall biosynthesis
VKVCFVCFHAYPLFNREMRTPHGGTEVQIFTLSRFLAQRGFDIDIVVGDHGQRPIETRGGVRVLRSAELRPDATLLGKIASLVKFLRVLARSRADVYIASPASPQVGVIAAFCRLTGRKFIYRTAHRFDCDGEYEAANGWRGRLYGFGLRTASAVVTQNDEHRAALQQRGIASLVIRNAFELGDRRPAGTRSVDALWVARSEPWKNPHLLLDIAERLPEHRFTMICPRQPGPQDFFEGLAARARSLPNVGFTEWVDFFEIQKQFDASRLFLGTSEYEGFPNTYLQACIGGTPIVSYKVNPDGFITHYQLGYCAEGDLDAMVEQVRRLLSDAADWDLRSANALRYVKERHDLETEGSKWARLIGSLAAGKGLRHGPVPAEDAARAAPHQ